MKKCLKLIVRSVLILVIVLIVALIAGLFFIDHVAKAAINNVAPIVAGVPVSVENISIKPLRGRIEITNFIVGNPAGYASDYAIKLGDVAAEVNLLSLTADKIIVPEVRLREVVVNYEAPITFMGSNLKDILDNISKQEEKETAEPVKPEPVKETAKAPEKTTETAEAPAPEKKKVRIQLDKLIIDNVQVRVISKGTDVMFPLIVELPDMGPLGTGEDGITPLGLTKELSGGLYEGIYTSVLNSKDGIVKSFTGLGDGAKEAADKTVEATKDAVKNLKNAGDDLNKNLKDAGEGLKDAGKELKNVGEGLKDAGKGLKNLFK